MSLKRKHLFDLPLATLALATVGSREGRLLLVQCNTHLDPEDGGRYTVKKYHSVKSTNEHGWQHNAIELQPLNPDYQSIVVSSENADDVRIVGEFVSSVGLPETQK